MSTKVKVSFPLNEKTIAVEKEISELENISQTINDLLAEIGPLSSSVKQHRNNCVQYMEKRWREVGLERAYKDFWKKDSGQAMRMKS